MAYATIADVEELWGLTFPAGEEARITALLNYASLMLDEKTPGIDLEIKEDLAKYVTIQMVMRVLRNPGGVKQATTGPTSATFDLTSAIARLVVLDEELELLGVELVPSAPSAALGTFRLMDGWE